MQLIRDIYPVDGPPHNRLEALELFMSIRIFDLGKESQVLDSILPTCLVLSCLLSSFSYYFALFVNPIYSSLHTILFSSGISDYLFLTFLVTKSGGLCPLLILNYIRHHFDLQLQETLMTVPGLVDYSTGRMRGRLIPSQFKSKKASELRTDDTDLGTYFQTSSVCRY